VRSKPQPSTQTTSQPTSENESTVARKASPKPKTCSVMARMVKASPGAIFLPNANELTYSCKCGCKSGRWRQRSARRSQSFAMDSNSARSLSVEAMNAFPRHFSASRWYSFVSTSMCGLSLTTHCVPPLGPRPADQLPALRHHLCTGATAMRRESRRPRFQSRHFCHQ
jgi:hypothetical protein